LPVVPVKDYGGRQWRRVLEIIHVVHVISTDETMKLALAS
jgi:hypothetical protein